MTQKVEAIEKLGFGVMDKIFLAFDKVFWDQVRYCKIFWDQVQKFNPQICNLAVSINEKCKYNYEKFRR